MKNLIYLMVLLSAGTVHAQTPAKALSIDDLLKVQDSIHKSCLEVMQGRGRLICKCTAVIVGEAVVKSGLEALKTDFDPMFEKAFEQCRNNEDSTFAIATSKLFQSRTAVEATIRGEK